MYVLIIVVTTLLAVEVLLRIAHIQETYSEQTGGGYVSYYNQVLPTWYHAWTPNKDIIINEPEIKYTYRASSLGLREREIPAQKPDSVKRLFVLGDSFTEGIGVQYANSMPRDIEKKLDSAKLHYEVYNAGVSGNDPVYEYMQLRDQLMPLHPTHVVVCINGSDITDIVFRGGMERFHADGTTHYKKGSKWEILHHYSRLYRLIRASIKRDDDQTFLTKAEMKQQTETAKKTIYDAVLAMKTLCDKNGVKLAVVIHPFPSYFTLTKPQDDIVDMTQQFAFQELGLVNTFDDFSKTINKENYLDYSLKINGHFNEKGYQLYADIIFNKINQQFPQYWQ